MIEANHIYLVMLEEHKKSGSLHVQCKKKKRKVIAQKKKKTSSKKSKKKETNEEKEAREKNELEFQKRLDEQNAETKKRAWEKHMNRVASLIQNQEQLAIENDDLMPFDFVATSDAEFEAQKDTVIKKIQHLLVGDAKPDDSIALFREARYLFANDRELFGYDGIAAEDEFETYKELIMKQLEIKKKPEDEADDGDEGLGDEEVGKNEGDAVNDENTNEDFFEIEENEEEREMNEDREENENEGIVVEEENLDFQKFLFRYTHPHILRSYILMLGEYAKNSDFINRCCMNMFERIAFECKCPQHLYQLSLFTLINKIYKDPLSRCMMNILDTNNKHQRLVYYIKQKFVG